MTTWKPHGPRCGSRDVSLSPGFLEAADRDRFDTTHVCDRCQTPFRVEPPTEQCLQAYRHPEVTL